MPQEKFSNLAISTLASGIAPGDVTITIQAPDAPEFATVTAPDWAWGVLRDVLGNHEIVRITAHAVSSSSLTIARGQQGTTALTWSAGALFEMRLTRSSMEGMAQKGENPVFTDGLGVVGVLREDRGSSIASASSIDLGAATGNYLTITHGAGTTAIASLGGASLPAGTQMTLRFSITGGSLSLTHNATNLILPGAANLVIGDGDVFVFRKEHDSNAEWRAVLHQPSLQTALAAGSFANQFGQCELVFVGATSIALVRRGGRHIFIAGSWREIPHAGVTVSNSAALKEGGSPVAGTRYYVYAEWNGSAVVLRLSAGMHVRDSNYGNVIHNTDSGAVLVGQVYMNPSTQFADENGFRYVRSFYNDRGIAGRMVLGGADLILGYAPWGELTAALQCRMLLWAGEAVYVTGTTAGLEATAGTATIYAGIGLNSTSSPSGIVGIGSSPHGEGYTNQVAHNAFHAAVDGFNYVTLLTGHIGGTNPTVLSGYCGLSYQTGGSGL